MESFYRFPKIKKPNEVINILWCSRFINWKHPEMPIKLARILKENCYRFHIRMVGDGPKLNATKQLALAYGVNDVVDFPGNVPNDVLMGVMSAYDIFLFTSDNNEGWGAVANEAMTNGCTIVGSDKIGSIPYLVEDNYNGLVFKSSDVVSLYKTVKYLLDSPEEIVRMSQNGFETMR